MTTLLAYVASLLLAWSPALTCEDLRAELTELAAQVFRLEVENRALRAVAGRRWPGE